MDEFTHHCTELLAPLGAVRVRRMFGGHGFYVDGLFLALILGEQLYLKADAETRPRFEAEGCAPFRYTKTGKNGQPDESVSLSYYRPPEEAMESPALMQPWARLALQAALRAQAAKTKKPRAAKAAVKPRRATSARPAKG